MAEWLQKPFSEQFIRHNHPPIDYGVYCSECGYMLEEIWVTEQTHKFVDANIGNAAVFLPVHYEYEYPDVCPCCKYIMRG